MQGGDADLHREREPTLERTRSAGEAVLLSLSLHMVSTSVYLFATIVDDCFNFISLADRSQMAHPVYQDPEPSEAKRRRKRLTQQTVQGKSITLFGSLTVKINQFCFLI